MEAPIPMSAPGDLRFTNHEALNMSNIITTNTTKATEYEASRLIK